MSPFAAANTVVNPNWYIDSGATNHVTADYLNLSNPSDYSCIENITVRNGDSLYISYVGDSYITDGKNGITLKNVLCVSDIMKNLVSVSKLAQDNNAYVEFHGCYCFIKDKATGQTPLNSILKDGLYHLETDNIKKGVYLSYHNNSKPQSVHKNKGSVAFVLSGGINLANTCMVVSNTVWHKRLGHPSSKVLNSIIKSFKLPVNDNIDVKFYDSCQLGKAHNLPFPISHFHATTPFDFVYFDLWGPTPVCSSNGFRYYILFVDDYNRYSWIYPLKQKYGAVEAFNHFVIYIKNQFNKTIKEFQSDNGREYKKIHQICSNMGVISRFTCLYTSS
ncbi:hypothetical protein IC582_021634 [Cucumis melo]